jgi:hypothetical protein
MSPTSAISASAPAIDEQAVAAFVSEMVDSIENTALAIISNRSGHPVWQRSHQSGAPDANECKPANEVFAAEPVKRPLGRGNVAYDFPLKCTNVKNYTFTLIVYSLDPPSLTSVEFKINNMLSCISRQIDVDVTLSTTSIDASRIARELPPIIIERNLSTSDIASQSLQNIVDLCFSEHDLECVATIITDCGTTTVACIDFSTANQSKNWSRC